MDGDIFCFFIDFAEPTHDRVSPRLAAPDDGGNLCQTVSLGKSGIGVQIILAGYDNDFVNAGGLVEDAQGAGDDGHSVQLHQLFGARCFHPG